MSSVATTDVCPICEWQPVQIRGLCRTDYMFIRRRKRRRTEEEILRHAQLVEARLREKTLRSLHR